MIKTEIFLTILAHVCHVCRVTTEDVINYSRVQSVVDARVILVYSLRRLGFSNDDIATMFLCHGKREDFFPTERDIKTKAKGIATMWGSFNDKIGQSYIFNMMAQEVSEFVHNTYQSKASK